MRLGISANSKRCVSGGQTSEVRPNVGPNETIRRSKGIVCHKIAPLNLASVKLTRVKLAPKSLE